MANFNNIKHEIDQNVNTNGVQAITGAILNETLKDMIDDVDSQKQDTLVAGQNITISGNVISATGGGSGTTYTAGDGIDIDGNNVISVDASDLAGDGLRVNEFGDLEVNLDIIERKLTPGQNITISSSNVISATDTTYSAGSGLSLNGTTFSADTTVLATKSDLQGKQDTLTFNLPININGGNSIELLYGDGLDMGVGDALVANLGNGLQFDANSAIEVDTNIIATQQDLANYQPVLTAGDGIEIDQNNEISVKAGSGLGFDANGYLINTGGGGGGTTYTAGDGIEIDSNDAINAKLGNGLQLDGSNNIEVDTSVVATQNDLSSYLRNDASGTIQNFLDGSGDTELKIIDGNSEDYVKLGAYETGSDPYIEIFENGSGDTKFFYDHMERGSQVSIDYPSTSGTLALTSDIPTVPTASSLAGNGLQDDGNGALEIDTTVVATQNDLSGYLPLTGGTLNNTGQINTNLSVQSPNSDYHVNTYVPNSGSVEIEIGMSSGHAVQNPSDGDVKNLRVYKDKVDLYTYDSNTSNWRADSLYFPKKKTGTIALDSDLAGKQDTLVSGTNIKTINGNSLLGSGDITISGGQSYTAGNGIDITSGTISVDASDLDGTGLTTTLGGELAVDTTVIQEKLTAGTGISISAQNVISATGGGGTTYTAGTGISIDANNQISAKIANGYGLGTNLNGELLVDAGALAGNGLQVDQNGQLEVVGGGGGSGLWTSGSGVDSLLSIPSSTSNGTASGARALSAGWYTTASGDYSVALGNQTSATRTNAFAVGKQSDATGISSVALGDIAAASGDYSVALGSNPVASGTRSFATSNASASGTDAIAIGNGANASANLSVALGTSAKATNSYEIGLGKWNKSTSTGTDAEKTQFTVGNGTALGSELNIIEAKKNNDVYLYGVGGFTGANSSQAQTLQDVINNASSSYTAGSGIDITSGVISVDTTTIQPKLSAGSNISISGNTISATDTTYTAGSGISISAQNVISATGGGGTSFTPGDALELDQNDNLNVLYGSGLTLNGNNELEVDPTSITGFLPDVGGALQQTDPNETATSLSINSPLGNGAIELATDDDYDGDGNSKSQITLSDSDGSVYIGTTGINNGSYTASWPSPSADTTFATLEDVSGFLPLEGGQIQDTAVGATETLLDIVSPDSTGALSFSTDTLSSAIALSSDRDDANVADGTTYGVEFDNSGDVDVLVKTVNPLDPTDISTTTYTQTFQQKSGTIALLSDITGGGTTYTAGTGINIDAQNVISNSAPSKWVVGSGTNSLAAPGLLYTRASGNDALAICNGRAAGNYSLGCGGRANSQYSIALGLDSEAGTSSSIGENSVAIGRGTITQRNEETALGYYNYSNNSNTASLGTSFSIGAGGSSMSRSNVLEFKDNKDLYIYGIGGFTGTNGGSAGINSLQVVLNGKQDTLTAGTGISISGNVISATGGGGGGLWTSGTGTDSLVAPGTVTAGLSVDPAQGTGAISCGYNTNADGDYAFASGGTGNASGDYSFAANNGTSTGDYSASFGSSGAYGNDSFAAGTGSIAGAQSSVALAGGLANYDDSDPYNIIDAAGSVAIGNGAAANAYQAIVIGSSASTSDTAIDGIAIGVGAYANAQEATAIGSGSHAEGLGTVALSGSTASGEYSTAMSTGSAAGAGSVAGGIGAIAGSYSSVALGFQTMTYDQGDPTDPSEANAGEAAFGRYNYTEQDFIFSVGCGQEIYHDPDDPDFEPNPEDPDNPDGWTEIVRQNAITITTDGSIYIKGAGGYLGQGIAGADSLQTMIYNLNPQ